MISSTSIDRVTGEELELCIEKKSCFEPEERERNQINILLSGIKMDMKIKDPENRVRNYFQRYILKFENNGLHDLPYKRPHVVIKHFLSRIEPKSLYLRLKQIIFRKKDEEFDCQNIPGFIQELVKQAMRLDETENNEFKFNKKRPQSSMKSQQEDSIKRRN